MLGARFCSSLFRLEARACGRGSSRFSTSTGRALQLIRSANARQRPQASGTTQLGGYGVPHSASSLGKALGAGSAHGRELSQSTAGAEIDRTAAVYTPPKTGILAIIPKAWVPYAELTRLDKPAGTVYLFLPCLFSTLLAAIHSPSISPLAVLGTSGLFITGAFIMRGAGCTINDLWDRNLDPMVTRTALRPLARRAVTPQAAIAFTGAQLLAGLALLLQFPTSCLFYGIPSLALVATYPLAKRVTYYPQFVLGLTFSWGAMMGFPALDISLLADAAAAKAAALLYASCVSWTVLYDMIYAHMDVRDDRNAGIKSIALRHENETKSVLTGLAVVQVGLLAAAGAAVGAGPAFFTLGCGSAAATLGTMIWRVNLKSVADCWWWFTWGAWFTGGGISLGMLAEYLIKRNEAETEAKTEAKNQVEYSS